MNQINHADNNSHSVDNYTDPKLTDTNVDSNETRLMQINNALNDILSDDKFRSSPKMSAFLSYVVEETLSGKSDRIKAYSVGVDALGKPECFDPQSDPSVRVLANRLRATLDHFYTMNPEQSLFIKLYRGSYVPHFLDRSGYKVKYDFKDKVESVDANQKTPEPSIRAEPARLGLQSFKLALI